MMELQENLTSILNLISEVNSSVSGISPIKILRPGRGYISCLSSYFRLRLVPERDPQGFFITLSVKTTDVESREGSTEEKLAC